jgi:hypothetical protein
MVMKQHENRDIYGGELKYQHTVHLQKQEKSGLKRQKSIKRRIKAQLVPEDETIETIVAG